MGSDWKKVGLNDLGEVARGKSRHRPRYAEHLYGGKYPFVQTGDIKASGGLVTSHSQTYSEAGLAQSRLWPTNTMCITIAANIAETGILTYPACFPDSVIGFVADEKKCDVRFVEYHFRYLKKQLQREAIGSVQDNINLATFERLKFSIPAVEEQKRIADILYSLDSKIHLNQKTNQTLEQMAQALFKSWFVDFDPVFDNLLASVDFKLENLETSLPDELKQKAQRRLAALNSLENATECKASLIALAHDLQAQLPTKEAEKGTETPVKANFNTNPNILTQHANTHAHFPNEFEHNEQLGWIPKGWEAKTIDEICRINPESWTKKNAPQVVKYVDLANAKNGAVGETIEYSFSEAPSRARRVLRPHDTIIGVVRPANRSFAYVNEENLTGSTGFAVVRANNQNCRAFAYFSLTNDDCIQEFTRIADGAAYPAIKPEDVANTYCIYSNNKILDTFESSIGKFMAKVAKNEQQNRYLTKLRDTLLPKLISGEVQIPDVTTDEKIVD
ncbi:restriction endonuclease subunit S [Pseudoalteromonas sp. 2CM32C]|uniref:restriction endonuclease subunit S n=1 Tax=Pseudoalteromonas sp. 2CM32C TaxID=2929852 RepID=UPI0020BEA8B1|nr:restriction endonuclease subunit S [Pseudoalteromonas sp. 2CM32C]MCK8120928.1 restriction endonuclease subunit S [Pseudoalteromonas sp. 2CM32C]